MKVEWHARISYLTNMESVDKVNSAYRKAVPNSYNKSLNLKLFFQLVSEAIHVKGHKKTVSKTFIWKSGR